MLAFVNFLRFVFFPLGLALLYGFGEFRRSIEKNSPCPESERIAVRTKAVGSFAFWTVLSLPFALVLNAYAQDFLGKFFVRSFDFAREVSSFATQEPISAGILFVPTLFAVFVCVGVYRWLLKQGREQSPPTDASEETSLKISAAFMTSLLGIFFIYPFCAFLYLLLCVALPTGLAVR